jgi:universal stress protein A
MKLFSKILCPIDFSEDSVKALQWSQHLAMKYGSQVTVLHVMEPYPVAVDVGIDYDKYHAAIVRDMRAFLAPLEIPFQSMQSSGLPSEKITTLANTLESTLIIMGTRGLRGTAHRLIGSTTESVIRHSPVPVLTLSPECSMFSNLTSNRALLPISKLVWPVPGSIRLRQVLRELDATLTLLHVEELKNEMFNASFTTNPTVVANYQIETSTQALRKIGSQVNIKSESSQTTIQFGDVSREILREADAAKYGWIIMGAKSKKLFSRFFGSTVYNVISQARVPVITIRI